MTVPLVRQAAAFLALEGRTGREYRWFVPAWDTVPPELRASDAERENVIRALRDGSIEGRLSHETFIRRVDRALRARGSAELAELLADLRSPGRVTGLLTRSVAWWSGMTAQLGDAWRRPRLPGLMLPHDDRAVFTIGRSPECDLALGDLTVSWRHAELRRVDSRWVLVDLRSTNGTLVNGWQVGPGFTVRPGDCVTFGQLSFRLADHP